MAEVVLQDYRQIVLTTDTATTTSGTATFDGFGAKELNLIINVTAVTGSITFEVQEVDPIDMVTVVGNSSTGATITVPGVQIVSLPMMYGGTVLVTWTVVTGPVSVNASLLSKVAGTTALFSEGGVSAMGPAGTPGPTAVTIQGIVGGTSVPVTFTPTGDLLQTGTITTATGAVTLTSTQGDGNVSVTLGATAWTGTVDFQGLAGDGTTWVNVLGYGVTNGEPTFSVTSTATVSGNGSWTIPCSGYGKIRVVGNVWLTGTITVALEASMGAPTAIFAATGGLAAAGASAVGWPSLVAPITDNLLVGQMAFGEAYRLRVGNESLGFLENFDGSTVNTVRWTQSTVTMTQVQTQTSFDMNNNATTTANAYSILTSTKKFMYTGEYGTEARIKAKLTSQANAVIELGFFTASTNTAPTNGVFFRVTSAGTQELVINFNGTETVSAAITPALTPADYYTFVIYMYGTIARLDILNWDNSIYATTTLQIPATQGALIQKGHIPVAIRVYDTATPPASAADIIVTGVTVSQLDLAGEKEWTTQLGDIARWGNLDPLTGVQLQQFTNDTAPATTAAASLSNTTAAYTTLGGLFAFAPPASSENDFIIFAYQVPADFDLMIWSVTLSACILGVQSTTTAMVHQWAIAVGSSAVSLATAGANPPIRQAMGFLQSPKSASLGDSMSPNQLVWTPKVPICCYGGKYVHIFFRPVSSHLTVNQIVRGTVTVDGAFQ